MDTCRPLLPAGPSPSGPAPVRGSQPPTVPPLLHALRMPLEDPSLYPFGVSAPSRVPSALVKRCSHTVPGHRAFRRTSGQVAQCEWVATTSAPLGALSRCWGAGDQCLKIQMSGGRGQGSQATSSILPFLAGGPLWPACRLEAWLYLLPRPCSAGLLPLPQSGGPPDPPAPAFEDSYLLGHSSSLLFSLAAQPHDWALGSESSLASLLVESLRRFLQEGPRASASETR